MANHSILIVSVLKIRCLVVNTPITCGSVTNRLANDAYTSFEGC